MLNNFKNFTRKNSHLEAAEVAVVMLKSYSVQTVLWSKISVKTVLSTVT